MEKADEAKLRHEAYAEAQHEIARQFCALVDEIRLANEIIKRARAALEIHRAAGAATSEESARCARGCLLRVYEP